MLHKNNGKTDVLGYNPANISETVLNRMKRNELFSRDWCNLVFQKKNKAYGAYVLRSRTGRRYCVGLVVMFFLYLCVAVPSFIWWYLNKSSYRPPIDPIESIARMEGIRLKEAIPVQRSSLKTIPTLTPQQTTEAKSNHLETVKKSISFHPEDIAMKPDWKDDLTSKTDEELLKEKELRKAESTEQTSGSVIDSIPQYPQGIIAFMRWLEATMVYPPASIRKRQEGTVEVAFIVEPDGSIADPRIIKGASAELNHEALRVLHLMPNWLPARRNGKNIRAQVTLPIEFHLDP